MKNLSIEEKAKNYDAVVEKIRKCISDGADPLITTANVYDVFPELNESYDNKMKRCVKYAIDKLFIKERYVCDTTKEQVLSWLDMHLSNNEIDDDGEDTNYKLDPEEYDENNHKFNEGDWIIRDGFIYRVERAYKGIYDLVSQKGSKIYDTILHVDKYFRLWEITDAFEREVLVCKTDKRPFIFKGFLDKFHLTSPVAYGGIDESDSFSVSSGISWWTDDDVEPATKEQIDKLIEKMKDAGYELDEEHKELINNQIPTSTIIPGRYYYCIKDYYAGGSKRASKGDVIKAKEGMSMIGLTTKADEYFLPVNSISHN